MQMPSRRTNGALESIPEIRRQRHLRAVASFIGIVRKSQAEPIVLDDARNQFARPVPILISQSSCLAGAFPRVVLAHSAS